LGPGLTEISLIVQNQEKLKLRAFIAPQKQFHKLGVTEQESLYFYFQKQNLNIYIRNLIQN